MKSFSRDHSALSQCGLVSSPYWAFQRTHSCRHARIHYLAPTSPFVIMGPLQQFTATGTTRWHHTNLTSFLRDLDTIEFRRRSGDCRARHGERAGCTMIYPLSSGP